MAIVLKGLVIHGDGYGHKLGYPTVNLAVKPPADLKEGVYAGVATLGDQSKYKAGIVIGAGKVEAHLLGFSGDLYDKEVEIKLEKFLREYKHFNTEEELKEQIKKDLEQI